MKIFYKIWADNIVRIKAQPQNEGRWKLITFVLMTMAMALNFITAMAILQRNIVRRSFYNLNIDVFPGTRIDAIIEFAILFLLPMMLINYFLVFYNRKYEEIIKKYKTYNGKLGVSYLVVSYLLPFILMVVGMLVQGLI